jgi:hypothetical protein
MGRVYFPSFFFANGPRCIFTLFFTVNFGPAVLTLLFFCFAWAGYIPLLLVIWSRWIPSRLVQEGMKGPDAFYDLLFGLGPPNIVGSLCSLSRYVQILHDPCYEASSQSYSRHR